MTTSPKDHRAQAAKILAKALKDEQYKQRLLKNPNDILKEEGIIIPPGSQVKVLENTENIYHLVIPAKSGMELTEEDLASMSGGCQSFFC